MKCEKYFSMNKVFGNGYGGDFNLLSKKFFIFNKSASYTMHVLYFCM